MKKLPKTIFVRREKDGDSSYLVAEEDMKSQCEMGEKRIVGEYKLVKAFDVTAEVKSVEK